RGHVRDQHGARKRRLRAADDRAAGRPEPLREGPAVGRRPEPDELHPRIRADQVAPPADQRPAGLEHAAAAVPADAGERRRSVLLLQLLSTKLTKTRKTKLTKRESRISQVRGFVYFVIMRSRAS